MKEFQNIIQNIYEHIGNEYSKEMFTNRLLYSLTNDYKFLYNIICMTDEGKLFYNKIRSKDKKMIIFGAGIWGKELIETYRDVSFQCFVDNKSNNDIMLSGIPVLSFQKYINHYKDEYIIISSRLHHKEMYRQLRENNIDENLIINMGKMIDHMSKRQYFDLKELKTDLSPEEVFVDAGSFDGKTAGYFMEWCNRQYEKIWLFEPDKKNQEKCIMTMQAEGCKNYKVIKKGLWDREEVLRFQCSFNGSSKIEETGEFEIEVVSLDEIIKEKVTFIKMDIEGSEYQALSGAGRIIKQHKPKLAISVYHKSEDIWKLPELILELNDEYKIFFRHYSVAAAETVVYAI
jgi:FkbM family methyltransferase